MSTFISHLKDDLSSKIGPRNPPSDVGFSDWEPHTKQALRTYFLGLHPPESLLEIRNGLDAVRDMESQHLFAGTGGAQDSETEGLRAAILAKLVLGLYIQCLNLYLEQAGQAETDLEWWGDIERSRWNAAYYLLQSFPYRLASLTKTVVQRVHGEGISLSPSVFTPSSLRQLFPSNNILRPNILTVAIFPHLKYEPYSVTLSTLQPRVYIASRSPRQEIASVVKGISGTLHGLARVLWSVFTFPIALTKNECRYKRNELAKIRDARATTLGSLYDLRDQLENALEADKSDEILARLSKFCCVDICRVLRNEPYYPITSRFNGDIMECLDALSTNLLPEYISHHHLYAEERALGRPSRLILLWPKLVFLPPLTLYAIRAAYNSRDSLGRTAQETWETIQSFWRDWLVGPVKDMIETVRTGGDESIIVTKESVKADLDSLERMALALARDKLNYTSEQMAALSQQIRVGDLTPVMQIYEEDIRNPLKSVVSGTLVRTLLVQVQKAKVDIDQTLTGIDKLLKSQELTFGFVGVSPAIALVYGFLSSLHALWNGSRGNGRYGGKKKRAGSWLAMRRIERLLIEETKQHEPSPNTESKLITPQTSGLLLLSTTHLRAYAEKNLSVDSRLREGFLEDVADLEDPGLGRDEKLRVLDRMWNSWGTVLGWHKVAMH